MADENQTQQVQEVSECDSIFLTVKIGCDVEPDDTAFDTKLLMYINSYLQVLWLQGVGMSGFRVTDSNQTWGDFLGSNIEHLQMAYAYICDKVRLAFDPPQSSALYNAIKEQANELGYYLRVESDILDREDDDDEED